ncbi:hypothetical protein MCAMS1_00788 [biofilm metagenome]
MTNSIEQIAKLLALGSGGGISNDYLSFVTDQFEKISNLAKSRGYPQDTALAVFDYILNHHYFDIDSQIKLKTIIDVVFEMVCPLAKDDERSRAFLLHLRKRLEMLE